ncbi:MAG: sugar transferase [Candidatus Eremiobacteraeota bacterium]|nr:sugar transferase [Candidatus Eremiobacteraeota bacterium]
MTDFWYRESHSYRRLSRIVDIVGALVAIVLTSPLVVIGAIAVRIESPGNPFFVQRRVGRFGRLFKLYKIRTMRSDLCGDALSPGSLTDSRITRVGAFLRKLSIDELPQFYNVLIGDMALVGPRPEMPFLVKQYQPWQLLRLFATPGITGLWQVECRSTVPLHSPKATALDLQYIKSASPLNDGLIVLRTVRAIINARGAY